MKPIPSCVQVALALILSLLAQRLAAQTLSLSPTSIGSISHFYDPEFGDGDDNQPFTFGTPSVQLVNDNTIQVSVNAPSGEAWNVSYTGQGFSSATLRFELYYNNGFAAPYASIISSSLQFDFVNGSSASLGSFFDGSSIPDSGDRFDLSLEYDVVGDFAISGLTASITFDNSTLAAAPLSSFGASYLDYQYQPSSFGAPDPGPQLTLETVPEPSPIAFIALGLGGLGILTWYRRSRFCKSAEQNPFSQRKTCPCSDLPPITTDVL
ncbi:MAG TPA: PEP-CTERM sorting domain-containing protein [Candidatus Saccharimonadales bacterium]|nr:PEP-CTERM sorting domain-containing protein [Candidatus Saccharimonadales bacterium]